MTENTLEALATIFSKEDKKLAKEYADYRNRRDNFDAIVAKETEELLKKVRSRE